MPFVKVTKNIRADWSNGNLWLDYKRSKSGMPMFIKLLPSVIQLIEKFVNLFRNRNQNDLQTYKPPKIFTAAIPTGKPTVLDIAV